jgi:hypothetical protein
MTAKAELSPALLLGLLLPCQNCRFDQVAADSGSALMIFREGESLTWAWRDTSNCNYWYVCLLGALLVGRMITLCSRALLRALMLSLHLI